MNRTGIVILLALSSCRLLLVLLLLGSLAGTAAAESSVLRRPTLHWVRSDDALGCVDPRALSEHVEALVGPVLVRAPEAEHSIEGQVEVLAGGKLRVRVRVLDANGHTIGQRSFEQASDDCADLTPAIVFVIAMVIDPDVAAHGLPPALMALIAGGERPPEQVLLDELDKVAPPPESEAPAAEPMQQVASEAPTVAPGAPRPSAARTQVGALVRTAVREAPRLALSLELRLSHVLGGPVSALAYVRGGGQLGQHDLGKGRGMRLGLVDVGAAACAGQGARAQLRVIGCFGVELANALVHGDGFTGEDKLGVASAFGLVAQLTLRMRIAGPWGVGAMLSARMAVPASERRIVFTDGDLQRRQVARLPALSAGIALGPTYEF
jgi:hypothetical protein